MSRSKILFVRNADRNSQDDIVVKIEHTGQAPLDLSLQGSEGAAPYHTSLMQSNTAGLKSRNYKGEDPEWNAVISWTLLGQEPLPKFSAVAKSVELVGQIVNSQNLTLVFQQSVEVAGSRPITQRLGFIMLQRDDDLTIDPLAWAATAASANAELLTQQARLEAHVDSYEVQISKMRDQLEELTEAKNELERKLLEKFRELLNEKKLKIRDQQRLLSGAKIDPAAAGQVNAIRQSKEASHKPTSSRMSKRKAGVNPTGNIPNKKESDEDEEQQEDHDEDTEGGDPMRTPETTDEGSSEGEDYFEAGPGPKVPSEGPKSISDRDRKKGSGVIEPKKDAPPPPRETRTEKTGFDVAPDRSKSQTEDEEETDDEL